MKFHTGDVQILGIKAQNSVIWETWHLELVHTWHTAWAVKPADVVAAHLLSHNGLLMKSGITLNYLHSVLGQPATDWSSQKGKKIPTVISSVEQYRGNVPVSQEESVNTGHKQFLFSTSQTVRYILVPLTLLSFLPGLFSSFN